METGRCGWGYSFGLVLELRLGRVRFWWVRYSVFDELARAAKALSSVADVMKDKR